MYLSLRHRHSKAELELARLVKALGGKSDGVSAIRALDVRGGDWRQDPARPMSHKPVIDGRRAALALRREAKPVCGSLAVRYLESRALPGPSPALSYHPQAPLGRGQDMVRRPTLLSAIVKVTSLCAVQRSFLDGARSSLVLDLDPPRRMLGASGGGAVRLAWPADCLGLAEGLETAMSAMPQARVHHHPPLFMTAGNGRNARSLHLTDTQSEGCDDG